MSEVLNVQVEDENHSNKTEPKVSNIKH